MKSTIKFFLIVALFVSTAFAEGDMSNGGIMEGDMSNGGRTCDPAVTTCPANTQPAGTNADSTDEDSDTTDSDDTILDIVNNYLNTLFG